LTGQPYFFVPEVGAGVPLAECAAAVVFGFSCFGFFGSLRRAGLELAPATTATQARA
jgi:hypothetical protein